MKDAGHGFQHGFFSRRRRSVVAVISTGFAGGFFFAGRDRDVVGVNQAEPPPGPDVRPIQFLRMLMGASAFPILKGPEPGFSSF